MNRDDLINKICPYDAIYDCSEANTNCKYCAEILNKWLDEYDVIIRSEFANKLLDTLCSAYHYPTQSFADAIIEVVKDTIHDIEQNASVDAEEEVFFNDFIDKRFMEVK